MCLALIPTAVMSSLENATQAIGKLYALTEFSLFALLNAIPNFPGIGVTLCCAIYVIGFAYSWGPVVWVVCAEMFPMRERGKANSVTTFSNWFWTCIVGAVFPIASTASLAGCFGFFAAVVFIATCVSSSSTQYEHCMLCYYRFLTSFLLTCSVLIFSLFTSASLKLPILLLLKLMSNSLITSPKFLVRNGIKCHSIVKVEYTNGCFSTILLEGHL